MYKLFVVFFYVFLRKTYRIKERKLYGDKAAVHVLFDRIVFLESMVWYNLVLFLFKFNVAKPASVSPIHRHQKLQVGSIRIHISRI